jgi:L-methionine (R)-S-oxide reductase
MAEELKITATTKEEKYTQLLPQIAALLEGEDDRIANMGNVCAALKSTLDFFWVGFYLVKEEQLVLGPFQGPVACTRIQKGKGVCGTAWQDQKTIIVEDVEKFPGHIACSALSKSEIVIPVFDANNSVVAVLDVDSDTYSSFDVTDELYLNKIINLLNF